MPYCAECGAQLPANAQFCGECGARINCSKTIYTAQGSGSGESVFMGSDWKSAWTQSLRNAGVENGIILTDLSALALQLGRSEDSVRSVINQYIETAKKRGVFYFLLDICENRIVPELSGNDIEGITALLKEICAEARPKYLFILGNEEIIDVASWENQSCDGDDNVDSDLPYTFLSTISPWEGMKYETQGALRVGRLPSTAGRFGEFSAYFENAAAGIGNIQQIRSYGLSAEVWQEESAYEYRRISNGCIDVSPDMTPEETAAHIIQKHANLMFYNLHGSDETPSWYGQRGGSYPEAVVPFVFSEYPDPFFLGVEACYGGRYIGLDSSESILKTALSNHCLAMLASSKIAYGNSSPDGCCADIIVSEFLKRISDGETAGDAYLFAVQKLISDSDMDDSDIKTLAEFSLYGDPSACIGKNKNLSSAKSFMKAFRPMPKGIHVPMPDVRRATRMHLTEVNAKIEKMIDDYVTARYLPASSKAFSTVSKKTYRMSNSALSQSVYHASTRIGAKIVKVYFDDNGKIHKAMESK